MHTRPVKLDALRFAIDLLAKINDPAERIRSIRALREGLAREDDRLNTMTREAVLELRAADPPATWSEIGEILKVSTQRAYQMAADYLNNNQAARAAATGKAQR